MKDSLRKLRVLVVDDNRDAADSMAKLVQLWGYEALTSYDSSAMEIMPVFRPDVVLLDIGMPGMDGNSMAKQMRLLEEAKDTLIIAVTGFHDEVNRRLSRDAGIDHYLTKPVDLTVLEKLLLLRMVQLRLTAKSRAEPTAATAEGAS